MSVSWIDSSPLMSNCNAPGKGCVGDDVSVLEVQVVRPDADASYLSGLDTPERVQNMVKRRLPWPTEKRTESVARARNVSIAAVGTAFVEIA
eukprot:232989-Rhodomonas_salina.1